MQGQLVSILFYATHEGEVTFTPVFDHQGSLVRLKGQSSELGKFTLSFPKPVTGVKLANHLITHTPNIHSVKDVVIQNLGYVKVGKDKKLVGLRGKIKKWDDKKRELPTNLYVNQLTLELPFVVEITFQSASDANMLDSISGPLFSAELQKCLESFDNKFEEKFQLAAKGFSENQISFAQAALSNMVGGIGYFYGRSKVISQYYKEPVDYWPSSLYTAVPSR